MYVLLCTFHLSFDHTGINRLVSIIIPTERGPRLDGYVLNFELSTVLSN